MKTIGTLKRANVEVRRHNERHPGRAFWLPAIALVLMASLATPASGALILNFSVTGTTSVDWSGSFDIVNENSEIGANQPGNVNQIVATDGSSSMSFTPTAFSSQPLLPTSDTNPFVQFFWSDVDSALLFQFDPSGSDGAPLVGNSWMELIGQTYNLSTDPSGFTGFQTNGGTITFSGDPAVIPEPSTLMVAGLFLGIGVFVIRRRRKTHSI